MIQLSKKYRLIYHLQLLGFIILITTVLPISLKTQVEETGTDIYDAEVGVGFGYGLHDYSSDLPASLLSNDEIGNECGSFLDGTGSGVYLQGLIVYRILPSLKAEISLGYTDRSGSIKFRCVDPAGIRMPDGSVTDALTDHVLTLDLTSFQASAMLWGKPFRLPLRFGVGGGLTTNTMHSFRLHEEVVAPGNAEFVSGGQVREYSVGELPVSISSAMKFGLSYDLRAGSTLLLRPVVSVDVPVMDEITNGRLRVTSFQFGLRFLKEFILFGPDDSSPLTPGD